MKTRTNKVGLKAASKLRVIKSNGIINDLPMPARLSNGFDKLEVKPIDRTPTYQFVNKKEIPVPIKEDFTSVEVKPASKILFKKPEIIIKEPKFVPATKAKRIKPKEIISSDGYLVEEVDYDDYLGD